MTSPPVGEVISCHIWRKGRGEGEFVLLVKSEEHMGGVALLCLRMYILNRGVRFSPHVDSETGNYEKQVGVQFDKTKSGFGYEKINERRFCLGFNLGEPKNGIKAENTLIGPGYKTS